MATTPLDGLIMRSAAVVEPGWGYIYAEDPANERPHAISVRFKDGVFTKGVANFDAHSITLIERPARGLIVVAGAGYYSSVLTTGTTSGDLLEQSTPKPPKPRMGGLRSVATIDGMAYAVGLRGIVYRFERPKRWRRLDDGLPETFEGQAIHGYSDREIYAVGRDGAVWQYDGRGWTQREVPATETLTSVCCAPDGFVYVTGHKGTLLKGRGEDWTRISSRDDDRDLWDVDWFAGSLYASSMSDVRRLHGSHLEPVDFGADRPGTCYQLSVGEGVMWSNGERDVMSFDGSSWTRVV